MRFRFRDWPVKWKLLGVGAAATAIPLIVTSLLAFRTGSALIRQSALALLGARADQLAGDLDSFHDSFRRAADRLATMPAVREFCRLAPAEQRKAEAALEATFAAFGASDPRTHLVALFDREGNIAAATIPGIRGRNYAFRRYFQSALEGRFTVSELFVSVVEAGAIPTIAYAAPVKDVEGDVRCVALVVARGEEFWDIVTAQHGAAGPGSHCVVYDPHGIRIAQSFRSAALFHPAGPLDAPTISMFTADRRFGEPTRQLLETPIPTEEEFSRARDGDVQEHFIERSPVNGLLNLGVARRLRTVPWTLFYLVPEPTVLAPVRRLVLDSVSANGAILGLALIAGLVLARRIIVPIRRLNDAARSIREGNLAATVPVTSADELGDLAATFNSMAAALRGAREELEAQVRVRTEALKTANESLALQNQALALRSAELSARQERDLAYNRALTTLTSCSAEVPPYRTAIRSLVTRVLVSS